MTLVVGILPNDKPVDHISSKALNAFSKGLKKFGIKTSFSYNIDELKVADIIVIWNMYNPIKDKNNHKQQLQEFAKHNPHKFLISIERGFILRESQYVSVGYNGICGFGNYYNHNMPPDRLESLKITLAKRKINGNGYILFCGQLPRDTQIAHINYYQWCQDTVNELVKYTNRTIIFRAHPLISKYVNKPWIPCGTIRSKNKDLVSDFAGAFCVIAYNSTSLVDAVIYGLPIFAMHWSSVVSDLGSSDLSQIENPIVPSHDRKIQTLSDIAYAQWNLNELASGECWKHIRQGINYENDN